MIRTRFAPSPTGYLHIGGVRTALFSWAYARKYGGQFVLRIEDTDQERSTQASVQAILDGMKWLGIDWDEGPYYQMARLDRYKAIADQLIAEGKAYYCYASKEELDAMREAQRARGEKPRYDGRWRPEEGKLLPEPPAGVIPVIRFKTPHEGEVTFDDLIKGPITVANAELDDLVIMRGDGVPTYNFGVVIDDWDMGITHVIRGDDHVNNTPRQINILRALGAPVPYYGHVPMILGNDGERLSKRHGAVSVLQYQEDGYLPEALLNYLARLGWGHGDAEKFSAAEFVEWFDLAGVSHAPARFNQEKLAWLNQQYMKEAEPARLAELVQPFLAGQGVETAAGPELAALMPLLRERVGTVEELADAAHIFYRHGLPAEAEVKAKLDPAALPCLEGLRATLAEVDWQAPAINQLLKDGAKASGLKMGQIGIPLRLVLFGTAHTPSIDATLALLGRAETLRRFDSAWPAVKAML
ncbi:glutamate--tRNA ligase [Parasulfuritortus cantonensis]|uniref:Glutamate--tRNA ligase n=1 Tax=Parasulfuritortus cantonensis TaxID=2528202 RepID=A0A4R1BQ56_9PROT|nr:glutamate--tRNA ligase [Parasulfuritortus cantonensis]TCJ19784.1 glutamate--tRNA ligase [Parasulfuritortus cantonensis]